MKKYILILCLVVSCFFYGCSGLQSHILDNYKKEYKLASFQHSELKEIDIEIKNIPWSYLTASEASPITSALYTDLSKRLSTDYSITKGARHKLLIGYQGSRGVGSRAGDVLWVLEIEALIYIIDKQNQSIIPLTANSIKVKALDFNSSSRDFSGCIPHAVNELVDSIVKVLASKYGFSK